jgi:TonB family protein
MSVVVPAIALLGSATLSQAKPPDPVYGEGEVDTPVSMARGTRMPQYPGAFNAKGVEGRVLARFVVDTLGRADVASLDILASTHDFFTAAVRDALPKMRFTPAELSGKKVRQLVDQPFDFRMATFSAKNPFPTIPANTAESFYYSNQVDEQARGLTNGVVPRYPDSLKSAKVEGEVVAAFIVDTLGLADLGSLKILKSTHPMFEEAVREAIFSMQFVPAEIKKIKVRQLVEEPFEFTLPQEAGRGLACKSLSGPIRPPVDSTHRMEEPVYQIQNGVVPRYPALLKAAGIAGEVAVTVVVDTSGLADMATLRIERSTHASFTESVRAAIPYMRFLPARLNGVPVRQCIIQPFAFNMR